MDDSYANGDMKPMDDMPASPEQGEDSGAYCIEIYVAPGGAMSVHKEPKSAEEAAMAAQKGTPVQNIDQAMDEARKLYGGGDDRMSVEQAFGQGFQGDRVDPKY